jgi:Phosphotransferase enzyme family
MSNPTDHALSEARAIAYILDRGLASPQEAVTKGLQVEAVSRRNCNFSVTDCRGTGWFLKQGQAGEQFGTVAYEAAAYRAFAGDFANGLASDFANDLANDLASSAFARCLPEFIDFDAAANILTIRLVDHATTFYRDAVDKAPSLDAIAGFARALASLHSLRSPRGTSGLASHPPPLVLTLDAPPVTFYGEASKTSIELIKTLQQEVDLMRRLRELREAWRSERLIHYDVKLSNILARGRPARFASIIDLEYLGYGDPCWDIGSVFAAYLDLWLATMPLAGGTTADRYATLATFPLKSAQAAMTAFWQAYAAASAAHGSDVANLVDCARFAAARLIHTAVELAMATPTMTNRIAALVQLGDNVLRDPVACGRGIVRICRSRESP